MVEYMDYAHGLARGVNMSDMEVLRFYNGILAALVASPGLYTDNPGIARANLYAELDRLNTAGMVAHIGHMGAADIRKKV